MHVHLPTPLHGWREFIGEVGIIVIGVLIALSAEQIVHGMQDRADEQAFEKTIDHEIGMDLFVYDVRERQFACDQKRAGELKSWLDRARSGKEVPPLWPVAPSGLTPYRSAWDNRDAQVFNHLPSKRREKYAEFYDELSNNWSLMEAEREDWNRLLPYAEAGPLTLADRRTLRPIIAGIRGENATLKTDLPASHRIARTLQVKEVEPDGIPVEFVRHLTDCRSAIASPAEATEMNSRA